MNKYTNNQTAPSAGASHSLPIGEGWGELTMKMTESQALHKLAAYCSKAEHCEWDVRKKISSWQLDEEVSSRVISRLRQEKFLDEMRYCKAFVRDKSRFGKWGVVKIEFELRKRRISEKVIREAISELNEEDSDTVLSELLIRKNSCVKAQNSYERRAKLIRFASGKGYKMDNIMRCIDKIVKQEDGDLG
jgi:regulatory protein